VLREDFIRMGEDGECGVIVPNLVKMFLRQ